MENKKEIAFFDFDGTLVSIDSFIYFSRFALGNLKVALHFMFFSPIIILCKMNLLNKDYFKEKIFKSLFKKMPYTKFKSLGAEFSRIIDRHLNVEIVKQAKDLQRKNVATYIVSASMKEWIEPWAIKNGFKSVISTEPSVTLDKASNKILTGEFSTKNCNNTEKVYRILSLFPDLSNFKSYGFGNSRSDFAMLNLMTNSFIFRNGRIHIHKYNP